MALTQMTHKFLFDQNIFDAHHVEPPPAEPEAPPPPTFSEAELEQARALAFEEGQKKARAESEQSREKFIAQQLSVIAQQLAQFSATENQRELAFDHDCVALCSALFHKLFPLLQEQHGLDEMTAALRQILEQQNGDRHVVVRVHPDLVSGLAPRLEALRAAGRERVAIEITGDESLSIGACALSWDHGGYIRDPEAVAGQVLALMKEALDAQDTKGDSGLEGDIR